MSRGENTRSTAQQQEQLGHKDKLQREMGRRQLGSGLPGDPRGQAQLAAAQNVPDLQPSPEIGFAESCVFSH